MSGRRSRVRSLEEEVSADQAETVRRVERDEVLGLAGYCEHFARIHGNVGRGVLREDDWAIVVLGDGLPINRAIGLGNESEPTVEQIERVEAFMGRLGLAPEIEVTDLTRTALVRLLEPRGYAPAVHFTWYVRFGRATTRIDSGITVDEDADVERWAHVNALGFDGFDQGGISRVNGMLSETTARSDAQRFTAWIDGEPVGSGAMAIRDGHAALFAASTLPRYRRRGVQAALLEHRVRRAREADCDLFSVKVEPGSASERNVARNGFRRLCAKQVWRGPRGAVQRPRES